MDKNIFGAAVLVPVAFASVLSGGGGGGNCTYTKPGLVFSKACLDARCREQVKEYLPGCRQQMAGKLTKTVRYDGGSKKESYLSLGVMEDLAGCMSKASFGKFNPATVDLSPYKDVSKDVRGSTLQKVGGGDSGSGLYVYPVVGQTTMLYGPA